MLEALEITHAFQRGQQALFSNISFQLNPGEVKILWGLNGSGKSTLLDILSAWTQPSRGLVLLNSKPLALFSPDMRAAKLGYLAQFQEIYFDLPIQTFLKSLNLNVNKAVYIFLTQALGLEVLIQKNLNLSHLSGGELAKLSFFRVLLQLSTDITLTEQAPYFNKYLLLDEPFSHLDWPYQQQLKAFLKKMQSLGLGILLTLHDIHQLFDFDNELLALTNSGLKVFKSEADFKSYIFNVT